MSELCANPRCLSAALEIGEQAIDVTAFRPAVAGLREALSQIRVVLGIDDIPKEEK